MKKFILIAAALLLGTSVGLAETGSVEARTYYGYGYGKSFIFSEGGITFSVYPDGEFDFFIDRLHQVGGHVNLGGAGITFNSGFDYNPYVQYDDYGAVIQVENVPIYYDFYGRVDQIGDVRIRYRNGRVHRVGGMYVYYTPAGYFDYYSGYINVYNRYYVYRPWHTYFARPALNFCLVYNYPYRRYYNPVRYTFYRPYRYNHRRVYASIGKSYNYRNGWNRRAKVYRNDDRVVARTNRYRKSDSYRLDNKRGRSQLDERTRRGASSEKGIARSEYKRGTTTTRSNTRNNVTRTGDSGIKRSNVVKRSSDGNRSTVKKRAVTTGPKRSVTRKSTTVREPASRSIKREANSSRATVKRNTSVTRTSPQKRSTVSRSSSTKRSYSTPKRSAVTRSSGNTKRSYSSSKRSTTSRSSVASKSSKTSSKARSPQKRSSRSGMASSRSGKKL